MTEHELSTAELITYFDRLDRLLLSPEQWTQEVGARDADGNKTDPLGPDAVCWCLIGGTYRVVEADQNVHVQVMMCFREALDAMGQHITTGEYNDASEFWQVKALITKARPVIEPVIGEQWA